MAPCGGIFAVLLLFLLRINCSKYELDFPSHPLALKLSNEFMYCKQNVSYCDLNCDDLIQLFAKVTNAYTALLMHDRAYLILHDGLLNAPIFSALKSKLVHMLAVLAFSQGNLNEVRYLYDSS